MAVLVLPGPLAADAGGERRTELPAARSVTDALDTAFERYPRLRLRLFDEQGELRPNVNVFIDGRNIRFEDGLATAVPEAAVVFVLPAISGG